MFGEQWQWPKRVTLIRQIPNSSLMWQTTRGSIPARKSAEEPGDTLSSVASFSIVGGNIVITSDTTVATSSITITDTGLFAALATPTGGFVGLNAPIVGLDISSSAVAAQTAVASLDTATDAVITIRAGVAATQNRMVRIINTQATVIENLQAAESQIRDADIAEEIALLTRNQILVEAATAMVGQANLIPQSVLQLLG